MALLQHVYPCRLSRKIVVSRVLNSISGAASKGTCSAFGLHLSSLVRVLRLRPELSPKGRPATGVAVVDGETNAMPDKQVMFEIGNEMLLRARRNSQPLTVLVFELSDLPELELVFGSGVAREAIDRTTAELRRLTTSKGVALWTSPTVCTVLLPRLSRDQAIAAVHDTLGKPCCIEFDADGDEIVLLPEFRVQTVDDNASIEEVYESLCREIDQVLLSEQHRQKYLERERESYLHLEREREFHSQGAELEVINPSAAATRRTRKILQADYPPMPATIAVALGGR